jgi:GNAT superfamily N-acetyltransferase
MPEASPTLRRASDADVDAIRDLVAAAYVGYTSLIGRTPIPMLADYGVAVREHEVWVLEAGRAIVGVLELAVRGDHLWIENVAVDPGWQGMGLGRRLLDHAEAVARNHGLCEIGLLTNERYARNIAIYLGRGYHETHREPHLGTDLVYFGKAVPPVTGS